MSAIAGARPQASAGPTMAPADASPGATPTGLSTSGMAMTHAVRAAMAQHAHGACTPSRRSPPRPPDPLHGPRARVHTPSAPRTQPNTERLSRRPAAARFPRRLTPCRRRVARRAPPCRRRLATCHARAGCALRAAAATRAG
eukprot:5563490-Prymnesium_polylepis.1